MMHKLHGRANGAQNRSEMKQKKQKKKCQKKQWFYLSYNVCTHESFIIQGTYMVFVGDL